MTVAGTFAGTVAKIHTVSPIDENHMLYGNFIGVQYVFEKSLDSEILQRTIDILCTQLPTLAGRYHAPTARIMSSHTAPSLSVNTSSDTVADILSRDTCPRYVHEPRRRDALKGRTPLSTFTLTELQGGGAVLGVAISHVLTDAAGFHLLMRRLGEIYTALSARHTPPDFPLSTQLDIFAFGTQRSKAECLKTLKARDLPKPISIRGLLGRFVKTLIIKAMDKSLRDNAPVKLTFSQDQLTQLKATVLDESGEDWISTNMALCAHLTSIMAKLSYGENIKTEMQIGQLLDLRGRYFETDAPEQSNFVGNAILIHIDKAPFPEGLQNTPRGALARYFKQRRADTTPSDIQERLDLLADCLGHGFTNPELDIKNPIISLNNQSKMPVYDLDFAGQTPMQVIPQDVGDNIMIFPAAHGGVEVYIRDIVNPGAQAKLLTPEWQSLIFDV